MKRNFAVLTAGLCSAVMLVVFITLICPSPAVAEPPVVVYCWENFTGDHDLNQSWGRLKEYKYQFWSTYEETYGRESDFYRKVTGYRTTNLNDDLRAIKINWDNVVVEVYEHNMYRGRSVSYAGIGKWVFPRWLWDRASSIRIYNR